MFRTALKGRQEGLLVGVENINNIWCADDNAILAENLEDLQIQVNLLPKRAFREVYTSTSTKWMVVAN